MRVRGLIILLVTPPYFKEPSIRKVDVFRPEISRDICVPEDDPGMPAVTYQVDWLGNRIISDDYLSLDLELESSGAISGIKLI